MPNNVEVIMMNPYQKECLIFTPDYTAFKHQLPLAKHFPWQQAAMLWTMQSSLPEKQLQIFPSSAKA